MAKVPVVTKGDKKGAIKASKKVTKTKTKDDDVGGAEYKGIPFSCPDCNTPMLVSLLLARKSDNTLFLYGECSKCKEDVGFVLDRYISKLFGCTLIVPKKKRVQ